MDKNCNECVHSTRDGGCRAWQCEGTVTVKDIEKRIKAELEEKIEELETVSRTESYTWSDDECDHHVSEDVEYVKLEDVLALLEG